MLKRILLLIVIAFAAGSSLMAQVTTSSITGTVRQANGEALVGATITAVHQPSGTRYVTISKKDGNFTIPNTKIGGPYTITVTFTGFQTNTTENVILNLGEPYVADIKLSDNTSALSEVIVTANNGSRNKAKAGASTIINSRMLGT